MNEKIIIEIRAGEGGMDSKMFAKDMAKMYQSYAWKMGFSVD